MSGGVRIMNINDIHFKIKELKNDYDYTVTFELFDHKITVISDTFDREFENIDQFHSYLVGLDDALTIVELNK